MRFWKKKKQTEDNEPEDNPWTGRPQAGSKDDLKHDFETHAHQTVDNIGKSVRSPISGLKGKRYHIKAVRKFDRILAGIYFVLFVVLSIISFPNLLFLVFVGAAYVTLKFMRINKQVVDWIKDDAK